MTSATSSLLTITNYVNSITLSASTTTPTMNFYFTLTASLYGQDSAAYTGSCTVTLTESTSSLSGTLTASNSAGTATFSTIYFTSVGQKTITATCPAYNSYSQVTQTIAITVQSLILSITTFTAVINM